jgi:prepilin-type N-terminal cleavage/methylation domain-containing protein
MTLSSPQLRAGLTLVELLIVMSILAVLVSLVIGLGRYADTTTKRHRAIAELGRWQEAAHQYHDALGEYPSNSCWTAALLDVRVATGGSNVVTFGMQMSTPLGGITNDPWNTPYRYVAGTNDHPQSFTLFSCGPDRQENTSDDVRFQP